jgi:hypothetical protein
MARRGAKRILTRDLGETLIGALILRVLPPLSIAAYGGWAILHGHFVVRNTSVHGTPAFLYGAAFVTFGLAAIGYPTMAEIQEGRVSRFTSIRMIGGLALFGVLIIAAIVTQF